MNDTDCYKEGQEEEVFFLFVGLFFGGFFSCFVFFYVCDPNKFVSLNKSKQYLGNNYIKAEFLIILCSLLLVTLIPNSYFLECLFYYHYAMQLKMP